MAILSDDDDFFSSFQLCFSVCKKKDSAGNLTCQNIKCALNFHQISTNGIMDETEGVLSLQLICSHSVCLKYKNIRQWVYSLKTSVCDYFFEKGSYVRVAFYDLY